MIVCVASGKGGTGKTTIAAALAFSAKEKTALLDCDVEEPNAHLFVHPKIHTKTRAGTPVPVIDSQKCTGCGMCEEICQFKAIVTIADEVMVFPELCHSCGGCQRICPEGAISETQRELGEIRRGTGNGLMFADGVLRIGEAMAPPLIRKVIAEKPPLEHTIIDAPPGTSCPVIAAMREADYVLLVTEPTPFGLNDLKLAVGAVDILDIPRGLIINRADMGDEKVFAYAKEVNLPVLMEIPFDRKIAEAYSRGEVFTEVLPEYKQQFKELMDNICIQAEKKKIKEANA